MSSEKKGFLAGIATGLFLAFFWVHNFQSTSSLQPEETRIEGEPEILRSSLFYPSDQADAFFKRGTTAPAITPSAISGIRGRKMKLTLVETKPELFSCNAPKSGCTTWKYFFEYVNTGKRWNNSEIERRPGLIYGHLNKKNQSWYDKRSDAEMITMLTSYEMVIIARNPYVRFLSSYQDWLHRVKKKEAEVPFYMFVDNFLEFHEGNKFKLNFRGTKANHIESISKYCQMGTYNYTVVRVEEQALWFNQFLKKYHLQEKMDEYTSHANLVFSSGIREGSFIKDFTAQISGRESWPSDLFKSSHHRGSVNKITQYYTQDIAKKVTEIVWDDLVNFGYPLWNGIADDFRLI